LLGGGGGLGGVGESFLSPFLKREAREGQSTLNKKRAITGGKWVENGEKGGTRANTLSTISVK